MKLDVDLGKLKRVWHGLVIGHIVLVSHSMFLVHEITCNEAYFKGLVNSIVNKPKGER